MQRILFLFLLKPKLSVKLYIIILIYGRKRTTSKRRIYVLKQFFIFVPVLFVGYMLDTLIPSIFNTPAIPGSGIAAFIATILLFQIAQINRVMGLSKENVSRYVFDDVKIPVIISDTNNKIVLVNDFSLEFLNLESSNIIGHDILEFFENSEDNIYKVKNLSDPK